MPPASLNSLFIAIPVIGICLSGCKTASEEMSSGGGSRLDPTSASSRAKLNAAQGSYGGAQGGGGGNDLQMKSFRTGGHNLGMPGFATKSFATKAFTNTPTFQTGGSSPMTNKAFSAGLSPFQGRTSPFSNKVSDMGNSTFATKGYRTKSYNRPHRGFRLRPGRSEKVIRASSMMQDSSSDAGSKTVGDIRSMLNR